MLFSVILDKEASHRLSCVISFGKRKVSCIVDTGCTNTLIPLKFARQYGKRLNKTSTISVGGKSYEATAYSFDNVYLGEYKISKLLAFSADYTGSLSSNVLLGLNVINNLEVTISRNQGYMLFKEDIWSLLIGKKYPFTMLFEQSGNQFKPVYPELLVENNP